MLCAPARIVATQLPMLKSRALHPSPDMPEIPLMDYIGNPLLTCLFLALLWLQWRFPLRRQHFSVLHRLVRNFVLSIPGFAIVRLAMLPIPIAIAIWARQQHVGLLNWFHLPTWAVVIATFLLMDYAYWWWHWAMHMVPFFWRFHNVHHTDLDLDVSTAARFHFGEMILSTGFLSLAVVLFGIGPIMLVVFFATFEAATLFHHSNWRLPIRGRADFEPDSRHAAHARDSSFHRAARDQFKLGHDVLLVGQAASHIAPGRAAGRHHDRCRCISRGKRTYPGQTLCVAVSCAARVAITKRRHPRARAATSGRARGIDR